MKKGGDWERGGMRGAKEEGMWKWTHHPRF